MRQDTKKEFKEKLTQLWKQLLYLGSVDYNEDFFSLGGNSLVATQLLSKIREEFDVECSLKEFFENSSLNLLIKHIENTSVSRSTYPPILKAAIDRKKTYPLSFAQQRLWFLEQLYPQLYNDSMLFQLTGNVDIQNLEKAFKALITRHSVLQAKFISIEGKVHQYFDSSTYPQFFIANFSKLSEEEKQREFKQFIDEEAKRSFDLSKGPLMRYSLINMGSKKHILLITIHHIVSDGWSMEILSRELSEFYNSYCTKEKPELENLPIHYIDFALWQRQWLQGDVLKRQLDYWEKKLDGAPDIVALPTDHPRPRELSYRGSSYSTIINKDVLNELKKIGEEEKVTLFMTLLAAFQAFLSCYSGQEDIIVGTPIANRHYPQVEGLIGFFANTLALRVSCKKGMSFKKLLLQTKQATLEAYEYQDLPFEQLIDYLKISRDLNRNPLFQVMFLCEAEKEKPSLFLNNAEAHLLTFNPGNSKFDLTFYLNETQEGLFLKIDYSLDLFEENTIRKMSEHFKSLISEILKTPDKPIHQLDLLTPEENRQILIEWNKIDVDYGYGENINIHKLFEDQVKKTPNKVAVVYENQELTYQQLNQKSNQLAHYLRTLGVGADTLVAVAVERSLNMVIAILGVLKAGGAYVPIDPTYPKERLRFMFEDTQASILITQSSLKTLFTGFSKSLICLDTDWQHIEQMPITNPQSLSLSQHLAYVIYTSGSTGKPKGIQISHGGVVNCIFSINSLINPTSNDTFFAVTSISFDVAAIDYYLPFLVGATVIIASSTEQKDTTAFNSIIKKYSISHIQGTPSLFQLMSADPTYLTHHKMKLMLAGEALSPELASKLTDHHDVFNIYGPTEGTIYSSFSEIDADKIVSIGRPLPNIQSYILNEYLNPVPVGVSGELYIGGEGLARGYLNRPDLTAERFIPNPFANGENGPHSSSLRLYRTGDLARYLPDGNIEFLGRIDDQVKIRGFRIELGEIESALTTHKDVAQVVVMAREDTPGDKKLVAYVVPGKKITSSLMTDTPLTFSSGEIFSTFGGDKLPILTEDLRNLLGQSLPDYMVPAFFLFLDKIPLTPNGKIDRKSLPAPDLNLRNLEDAYVAPQTPLQKELCKIWSEVLNIPEIGIYDNFFKIGGHSLLATQTISRIRHNYDIDIPLRALFEHPTVVALSTVIESLNQEPSLLVAPPLIPQEKPEHIPLSFAQQRLWFLDQLLPNSALYNVSVALKMTGKLNKCAFEKAFNALIERHESLRTIFPSMDGEAYQHVLPQLSFSLSEYFQDLSSFSEEEKDLQVKRLGEKEAHTPFNLSTGPLLRIHLLKLSEEERVFFITLHHIISDGWSMGVLFKDFSELYNAYAEGTTPNLSPLPIHYTDFALWQRKWLQGEVLDQQLGYWKQQLTGIPDLLDLPTDRPRPKELTYSGDTLFISFPKEMKDQLKHLAQDNQASLFMTLLAAFQILLYRYTDQKDIVVGSPIANRHYKETENLIGFFVNTLALRTTFEESETFLDVLKKVKETTLQAYQHQDIYFDQLVDYLNIPRLLNRNPVFQVEFALETLPLETRDQLNNLVVEPLGVKNPYSRFDLRVLVLETPETLSLEIEYSKDLFNQSAVERLAAHFEKLLAEIIRNSRQSAAEISFITPEEKQKLLSEWNDTTMAYPPFSPIQKLFEIQTQKTPYNVALGWEDQEFTYQELNERANQLAHYLKKLGVGNDTLVAIAIEPSLDLFVGILGILKAGGAYIPLDLNLPEQRLQYMIEDTRTPVILTDASGYDKIPTTLAQVICISEEWDSIQKFPSTNPESYSLPHHLAYIIYTSGSTGNPKGVMIEHGNLSNYLNHSKKAYSKAKGPSLFHSSFAFDMSITSIFLPLISGNSVLILSKELKISSLEDFLKRNSSQFSFIKVTPTHLKVLRNQIPSDTLYKQKGSIIIGGENLSKDDAEFWLQVAPQTSIFNEYGPTETTVGCCVFKVDNYNKYDSASTPIGVPIENTKMYLLDEHLKPVPVGMRGEIYIGGTGLARGYLNRPDLTAERFIPNPFGQEELSSQRESLRLYRTGDLAKHLPDGNIEFLGRMDDQVKIRGFRIELGEIECTLLAHKDVAQVIVIAREDTPDDKKLVAYVVPNEEALSSLEAESMDTTASNISFSVLKGKDLPTLTETLRNYLTQSLPEYMVPSFFVYVNHIPRTLNNKVDGKALPAPDSSLRHSAEEYDAPETLMEEQLCDIWKDVLKVDKIGRHDNFFKLGGHSLLATQVVSRIKHDYHIDIPLRDIFEHPTIVDLIGVVESLTKENVSLIPPFVPIERKDFIPLSFAQQRLWFFDQLLPDVALYNAPVALRLKGPLNINALEKTLNALISRHESLRTIFPSQDGQAYQEILLQFEIDLKECSIDLTHLKGKEQKSLVQRIAQEEANKPFNLSIGPLVRIKLLILSQEEHVLLITMHHIISDEWSMNVFFKEFSILYNEYCSGLQLSLPPLLLSYADFAVWQRGWLQGETLEQQLFYWKQQLTDIPDFLDLPMYKAKSKEISYEGAIYSMGLSEEVKDQLSNLAQQNQTSLFMTLLAVFQILLYRYTGQHDIVVGSPIANRHYKEVEDLIGFFVNTLALRTTFEENETFIDVLHKVKEMTLQAYQHQDVPFEQLVDHLDITRDLNRNPVFQVMFTFQNKAKEDPLNLQQIEIEAFDSSYLIAKFDLSLGIYENEKELTVEIEYATDLFDAQAIERMGAHFKELIEGIIKSPIQSIQTYSLLTPQEKHQLLIEWNKTSREYPKDQTIHQVFEEQVAKTPNNMAVVFGDQQLTFQELNIKANKLAHYLRELQIKPDQLVAICLEKSLDVVISLLAVWKAGGAYVPLDPDYPKDRLEFMLEDTQAPVLLTLSSLKNIFPHYSGRFIFLDLLSMEGYSSFNLLPISSPSHLAYVIYTSGSTGTPKGVMVEHTSLCKAHYSWCEAYNLGPFSSYLQMASFSFDVFIGDIIRALFVGVKLVLCPRSILLDPASLYQLIKKENIECAEFVPSVLKNLIDYAAHLNIILESFKVLIVGSDQWSVEDYQQFRNFLPLSARLLNSFGVTEATIDSTFFESTQSLTEAHFKLLPIGRPFSNTKIYILDQHSQPVPVGIAGELHIGGDGLARGYLNRLELTTEKFISNPFQTDKEKSQEKNARLYKTGDLCRWLEDGNIEYIGRSDDQVKIRGFRIELKEIEATLLQHVQVKQAVVIVREDTPGDKKLVGYVVPQEKILSSLEVKATYMTASQVPFSMLSGEGLPALTESLRNHLARSLPEYMVPLFTYIDCIPLTPNGKIDRKVLPAPDSSLRHLEGEYVAPQTLIEEQLCDIWKDVLKLEKVGVRDNFFRVGGDSIISIQLVSKARQKGLHFKVKDVFNYPTISTLALAVTLQEAPNTLPPVQHPICGEIPLTPIQYWFFEENFKKRNHYNQAVLLICHTKVDHNIIQKALLLLIKHHDILRTHFKKDTRDQWKQLCVTNIEDTPLYDINLPAHLSDLQFSQAIEQEANRIQQTLNIETGSLLRMALLNSDERPQHLLIVIHHLVIDGVSWRILLEDLEAIYKQLSLNQQSTLPAKTHSYQQWACELENYAQTNTLLSLRSYWQEIEDSIKPLPTDVVLISTEEPMKKTISNSLSIEETTSLLKQVHKAYRTEINDLLVSALFITMCDWRKESNFTFFLEGHGRESVSIDFDLSRTVGWFTSVFPVRLCLNTGNFHDFSEVIKTVKESLRETPNKGIDYGILSYLSQKKLNIANHHFTLLFNYLGQWGNNVNNERLFSFGPELTGESTAKENKPSHVLEINAEIRENFLEIYWTYSTQAYFSETVFYLAEALLKNLRNLIHHCCQDSSFGYTISDFTLTKSKSKNLEKRIASILKGK